MTQQETVLLNQFSTAEPVFIDTPEAETSVLDIVVTLFRHKKLIGGIALLTMGLTALAIFLLPPTYVSQALILPPQQQQSSMAALASGALGGLAGGMGSQLGLKNPADLYIGILKSRTISDDIIAEFDLQKVYEEKLLSDTRRTLNSKATFSASKESLITISIADRDPKRATAMANAFVEALYKQNARLAITGAAQKRLFFEQQLGREKDALANAEVELKATQQSTGLLVPTGQAEMLIRSGAQLRADIASRQVQLQSMRGYATEENPQVQTLKREISALQGQLGQVEASGNGESKLEISGARLPQASLEYVRKVREVKYHETLYELIAKQYEVARLDEAKEAPMIQVVDRAVVPDKPTRPSRALSLLGAALGGLVIGCVVAFGSEQFARLRAGLKIAKQAGTFA